jgi:hypothetical protein
MITIGADRFRSKAAASPEFGASSAGSMSDDNSKRLDSIERTVIEIRTKLDTVLTHLATKAELEAMRTDLIKWVVGAAVTGVALAAAITTLASA